MFGQDRFIAAGVTGYIFTREFSLNGGLFLSHYALSDLTGVENRTAPED